MQDTFAQPGRGSGHKWTANTCAAVRTAADAWLSTWRAWLAAPELLVMVARSTMGCNGQARHYPAKHPQVDIMPLVFIDVGDQTCTQELGAEK